MKAKKIWISLSFVYCILLCATEASAVTPDELSGKVAFIKGREVWIADKESRKAKQLTRTNGKVESFIFSPALSYLAYAKIIGQITEPGSPEEEGEEASKRPLYSVVILDIEKEEIHLEVTPPPGEWIYPEEWLSGDRLVYYSASGSEVSGFFEYDVQKKTRKEISWKPGITSKADISQDGLMIVYVSDSGREEALHLMDVKSKEDRVLVTKENIETPRISHDRKQIAFQEAGVKSGTPTAALWVYTLEGGAVKRLYIKKEGGVAALSWSFDDSYIGLWSPPEAVIIELRNPDSAFKLKGTDFHWASGNDVIFAQEGNLYLFRTGKREKELFMKDASKPTVLQKSSQERKLVRLSTP